MAIDDEPILSDIPAPEPVPVAPVPVEVVNPDPEPTKPVFSGKDEDFRSWVQDDMNYKQRLTEWQARQK